MSTEDENEEDPPRDGPESGQLPDAPERVSCDDRPDEWVADRPVAGDQLGSLWIRWTDGRSDLHLHRHCKLFPQLSISRAPFSINLIPESGDVPTFPETTTHSPTDGADHRERRQFKFLSGWLRQALRHTPLLVFIATVVLFTGAELSPSIAGISELVPVVTGTSTLLFGVYLLLTPVLIWLLGTVEVVDQSDLLPAAGVYGLVAALASGTLISVLLVATRSHPSEAEPNVIFVSGYLLTLLLGGMLLYEAILRIEHLFVKLADRKGDIIGNERAYYRFLSDMSAALHDTTIAGFHPSRIFSVIFVTQFAIIWTLGSGPQGLQSTLGIVVNGVLNFVLVAAVFQFFIIVRFFNRLMNETTEYTDIDLRYEPFHVDGYGGFRDYGRFATRINLLLTLGGSYLVYRLYVTGGRELPVEGLAGFTDPLTTLVWLISYVGPVVAYAAGVGGWGYYSFWSIHRKMERDKEELTRTYQGQHEPSGTGRTPSAGDTIDSFSDGQGPEWGTLRAAPTWPLEINKLTGLLSGNVLPLVVPVGGLLL